MTARSREGEIAIDASRDRVVDREIAIDGVISRRRDLDLREIAISDRCRRTGAREIGADWSLEFAGDRRTDWNVSSPLACARSLFLSLFFRKYFEVKMKV